jgi:3-oxo-5-alpha-steroid 4-dehydrogenase 1
MNEQTFFNYLIIAWFIVALVIFVALFFISAPYGRHVTQHWGLTIKSRTGWIVMESTAPLIMAVCFLIGTNRNSIPAIVFLLLWEAHYIHRAYIYPLHRRDGNKPMPLMVISLGFIFNAVNGYLNGRYIFSLSPGYENTWLIDPRFILGVTLFIIGFIINRQSDQILCDLRKPGESGYRVANTGLYRWVSSPNYLGEILIWTGWAIATWSLAGLAFAVWTTANLLPRARSNHLWYHKQFPNYPAERKALIPKIW